MTVQPTSTRRPRRSFRLSELRTAKQLYAQHLPMREIAHRLDRDQATLYKLIRHLDIPRRQPGQCGTREENRRRNAKVLDAILAGDSYEAILRRWEISPRTLYNILEDHRCRTRMKHETYRKIFGHYVSKIFTARP